MNTTMDPKKRQNSRSSGTSAAATLTDRYVWAAVRTVPAAQRAELEPEIRELVGDSVEAKLAAGVPAAEAEHAALAELGDPELLAASFSDRRLTLIGPSYYLVWWRLLKVLVSTVVPAVAAIFFVVRFLQADGRFGDQLGSAIGGTVVISLQLTVHICFWLTLTFAIIDRTTASDDILTEWTPERLPDIPADNGRNQLELGASLSLTALWAAALVWQAVDSPVEDAAGTPIDVLQPDLWSFWLPYFLVLAFLEGAHAVAVHRGGWNWPLAGMKLLLNVAFAVPAVWLLASGELLNPEFFAQLGWPQAAQAGSTTSVITMLSIIGITAWDSLEGALKVWRASRVSGLTV